MNSEFTIAVHSLVFLAHLPDHMATSEEIAVNVSTHSARIRKVMGFLRKAGYVSNERRDRRRTSYLAAIRTRLHSAKFTD